MAIGHDDWEAKLDGSVFVGAASLHSVEVGQLGGRRVETYFQALDFTSPAVVASLSDAVAKVLGYLDQPVPRSRIDA
ncbi:MAG: hypothetical protein ACRDTD_17280 [Pseudonocardiaceae bacterium]